jgi:hypothetical protein
MPLMRFRWLFAVALLSLSTAAQAAFSNYNSVLLGEKAAGLGGAFTALTGDSSATPFYNPAATVLMEGNSLSATVNVYNKYETELGVGSSNPNEAPLRVNRGFFRSLPSSSGTVLSYPSFAFGLSILVPDYEFYSGQIRGDATSDSFVSFVDESLWVGGTFSTRLTETDSVGVSLYYTARNLTRSVSDFVVSTSPAGAKITIEEKNLSANSVVSILGYLHRLSPVWSVGVSYRPPSLPISGEGSFYRSVSETTPYNSTVLNRGNLRALTKIPARLAVGLAREVKSENTLSFDVQISESLDYQDFPELPEGADQVDHRQVVNWAVGFEQMIRSWASVRMGYFTNLSSHPTPDPANSIRQGDHVDMHGFSLNFNIRTDQHTLFTFGGYYNGGSGESMQLVGGRLQVVPKKEQVFTMLVATGFDF